MTEALTKDFEVLYPDIQAAQTTDRIRVIRFGDPYSAPGTCVVCRSTLTPGKEFVDLGLDIEFYGAIYIDTICLDQVFKLCRYISVDSEYHTKLFAGYKNAVAEVGKLRQELVTVKTEVVENVISRISDYMRDLNAGDLANSFVMASISETSNQVIEHVSSGTAEAFSDDNETGSTNGSSHEQGSPDIFDLTDIEGFKFTEFDF